MWPQIVQLSKLPSLSKQTEDVASRRIKAEKKEKLTHTRSNNIMFQMNFIFFSLVSAFSFTQTRFSSNWKLKIKKISSVSDAIFWRRFVLEDLCSNSQILLHFWVSIKIVAMSSVYSMHRPGFWRVPKFKTKEPLPTQKKKVHFYDEFVSVFFFEEIIFRFCYTWSEKWQVDKPAHWLRQLSFRERRFISKSMTFALKKPQRSVKFPSTAL